MQKQLDHMSIDVFTDISLRKDQSFMSIWWIQFDGFWLNLERYIQLKLSQAQRKRNGGFWGLLELQCDVYSIQGHFCHSDIEEMAVTYLHSSYTVFGSSVKFQKHGLIKKTYILSYENSWHWTLAQQCFMFTPIYSIILLDSEAE